MTTEKIKLGNEEFEIEVKPITLVVKAPNIMQDIQTPGRFMIDSTMTLEHVRFIHDKAQPLHPLTQKLFLVVFPDYEQRLAGAPITPAMLALEGSGAQHVAGLIDMSLILIDRGVPIGWRYPESYLHPAAQCNLADVLIALMKYGNTKKVDVTL
jgi:hypothetical protein